MVFSLPLTDNAEIQDARILEQMRSSWANPAIPMAVVEMQLSFPASFGFMFAR
jgi:hypothetical protein